MEFCVLYESIEYIVEVPVPWDSSFPLPRIRACMRRPARPILENLQGMAFSGKITALAITKTCEKKGAYKQRTCC
jgi:hypothetical protein